jgi:hypothetical protein
MNNYGNKKILIGESTLAYDTQLIMTAKRGKGSLKHSSLLKYGIVYANIRKE